MESVINGSCGCVNDSQINCIPGMKEIRVSGARG